MLSNDPRAEDPTQSHERRTAFATDIESLPAADLPPLVTFARHRRRLWMVAIPGVGLMFLP